MALILGSMVWGICQAVDGNLNGGWAGDADMVNVGKNGRDGGGYRPEKTLQVSTMILKRVYTSKERPGAA